MSESKPLLMTLFKEIDHEVADKVVTWILNANMEVEQAPYLELYINSEGGAIYHGLAIMNAMRCSKIPVHTTCLGNASSMAAHVFIQGAKGHRTMLRDSSLLFHSARVGYEAMPMQQIEAAIEDVRFLEDRFCKHIAEQSKIPLDLVATDFCSAIDRYVYAPEAIGLGLCDIEG